MKELNGRHSKVEYQLYEVMKEAASPISTEKLIHDVMSKYNASEEDVRMGFLQLASEYFIEVGSQYEVSIPN